METTTAQRTGPLAGYRVLDLTAVVLGPLATQILGDYGADVIKIEPLTGDQMRANGVSKHRGMSSIFLAINRNKRSLAIDLKSKEGIDIIHRLLPSIDVLVHNMRVPAMERLGLGYAALAAIKPDLVYCVATGFGESGPDAGKPAFDDVIQAASGLAALIGQEDGKPDYAPTLLADKTCGMALCNAVLAGLLHRARTGAGQQIEVPMLETMVDFNMLEHFWGRAFDPPLGDPGYSRLFTPSRRPFRTADGHLCVTATTDEQWARLFKAIGRADMAADPRYSKMEQRSFHFTEVFAQLEEALARKTSAQWMLTFDEHDLPNGPAPDLDELFDSPYLKEGGVFRRYEHPSEGTLISGQPQVRYSRTPARMRRPPPRLGEHTREVLQALGLDEATMAQIESQTKPAASS